MSDIVVVGNGVAGYACAARLAERGVPVTLIGPGLPHDRPPLSKRALLTGRVPLLADAAQLAERGIEHVDGVVTECDLDRRRLLVSPSAGGDPVTIEAPTIVWATGLRYPKPPIPGFEWAEENSTGAGLVSLAQRLENPHRRVVVVGAGLIGTETAATLAAALAENPALERVDHPSLPTHPSHALAVRLCDPGRFGAVLTLSPRGGRKAGMAFVDALQTIPQATSLGGVHTTASHAASSSHRQLDDAALLAAGLLPSGVRLSVGLEPVETLLDDLRQALATL